jgi:hypothetical protein
MFSLFSLLKTILTGFILLFSYIHTKYIYHIYTHFPFPVLTPIILVPTPERDLVFPPTLHFFLIKCILIVRGSLALVLQVYIHHAFIKLTPSPCLLILYHHTLLIFNSLLYSALYYVNT